MEAVQSSLVSEKPKSLKEQLALVPQIKKRDAARRMKDELKQAKMAAAVPAPVDERMKLRERILSMSLFPNTHNMEFLLEQS